MSDIKKGNWQQIAICKCGLWRYPCPHGDLFHLVFGGRHINVCPVCGEDKYKGMTIKTARETWKKNKWYQPKTWAGWEIKEDS